MKEATGETSMTFITIAALAIIAAAFAAWIWPDLIKPAIQKKWNTTESAQGVVLPSDFR